MRHAWYQAKRRLAAYAALALLKAIDFALKRWGYRRTSRILLRLSPTPDPARRDPARAITLAQSVDGAARFHLVDVTCLRRSLGLWWMLRWLRLPSDVRLAFRLTDGKADGHAWVEHHGQVINDAEDVAARYPILYHDRLAPETVARL